MLVLAGLASALSGCGGNLSLDAACPTSVSALGWSIWTTPTLNAVELKVGEKLTLGLLTFSIGCTIPPHDEVWSQSNPTVASLTARSNGDGATLLGLQPGTTLVTGEAVGTNGARGKATQTFRVVP